MEFFIAIVVLILFDLAALRWGADSRVDERDENRRRVDALR